MSKNGFSYYKAETDRFQDIKIKRLKKKDVQSLYTKQDTPLSPGCWNMPTH